MRLLLTQVLDPVHIDHQVIFPPYNATEESDTLDGIVRNNAIDVESECWASSCCSVGNFVNVGCTRMVYSVAQGWFGIDVAQVSLASEVLFLCFLFCFWVLC